MEDPKKWRAFSARLDYYFRNINLLFEALTHPSCMADQRGGKVKTYQRLEFVGDKVLGLMAAVKLYQRFPEAEEGQLTRYMPLLVSNKTLGDIASDLKLGEYLIVLPGSEFAKEDKRILACALEALLGAIFIDSGCGYRAVEKLLGRLLFSEEFLNAVSKTSLDEFDPKSALLEVAQRRYHTAPEYKVVSKKGPDHKTVFTVAVSVRTIQLGIGQGSSRQAAEKAAAANVLEQTQNLTTNLPFKLSVQRSVYEELEFPEASYITRKHKHYS